MMRWVLASIIAIVVVRHAFAVRPASDEAKNGIQKQITAAHLMDQDINKAQEALFIAQKKNADPGEIRSLQRAIEAEMDNQTVAYVKAIRMTIVAYGLEPASRRGTSVMPWTRGREIEWLPTARKAESRSLQDINGKIKTLPQPKRKYDGITYSDGVTYIDRNVFENGVASLAATLLHERIHFEQYTTAGRGDATTPAEREVEAFKAELANHAVFFDPVKDRHHIDTIALKLEGAAADVNREREARKGFKGVLRQILPKTLPDEFDLRPHGDEELAEIKRQSDEIERLVAEELAYVRQEREAMKNRRIPTAGESLAEELASERRKREVEAGRRIPTAADVLVEEQAEASRRLPTLSALEIKALVQRACANRGGILPAEVEGKLWIPAVDQYSPGMAKELKGCAKDLWDRIMRSRNQEGGMVVDVAALNDAARVLAERDAAPAPVSPNYQPPRQERQSWPDRPSHQLPSLRDIMKRL